MYNINLTHCANHNGEIDGESTALQAGSIAFSKTFLIT